MRRVNLQKGFTLVELAIVLVIIGIILGAVLKGQELIQNAKIKRLYNQYREVFAAVYTYYDRYGVYPGDDPNAATRFNGSANGDGDGLIEVGQGADFFVCDNNSNSEHCLVWEHLRLSNIITGSGRRAPSHSFGGVMGIGYTPIGNLLAVWIGFSNVPGDVCPGLDAQYDDGTNNTGSIRYTINQQDGTCAIYMRL